MNHNVVAIRSDLRWAVRPQRTNQVEPEFEPFPKLARPGVIGAPQLRREAEISEDRNAFLPSHCETAVRQPYEQIQRRRRGGQRFRRFEVCRN